MPLADFDQLYRQADARPARQSPPWRGRPDGSQSAWRSSRGQEFRAGSPQGIAPLGPLGLPQIRTSEDPVSISNPTRGSRV